MLKTAFGVLFKVLFALAGVFGILSILWYLDDKRAGRTGYVEIYNDDDMMEEGYY